MNLGLFLASAILFFPPQTLPTQTGPLRNTFAVAAETVVDTADAVDIKADDAHFDPEMQSLKSIQANLARMADDDREHDIAAATNDLLFAIAACHIQAKDGAPTAHCEMQVASARTRTLQALNKHKEGTAWVDGPPS